jgi:hypothetical protein
MHKHSNATRVNGGFILRQRWLLIVLLALTALKLTAWITHRPSEPVIADQVVFTTAAADPWEELAVRNPVQFLQRALERYRLSVRSYRAVFEKQEQIAGRLSDRQVIEIKFREQPFSVAMHWLLNPFRAERVLYVAGSRVTDDGRELALVRPTGVISVLVPRVTRDIHGADSAKASRRTIDEFGFANTLQLILDFSQLAAKRGELTLVYKGTSEIDGRPTYLFERKLPLPGKDGPQYPDCTLLFHIDKAWLLPVACYSFADENEQELLGSYVYRDVRLNCGLTDADFTPESNGM